MFLESFRHLIELEALKKENAKCAQNIASENKRIQDLEGQRKKTTETLLSLNEENEQLNLSLLQKQIEDAEEKLKKLNAQSGLATTEKEQKAFEQQISSLKESKASLEENYFENLEKSESLLEKMSDGKSFLQGSLQTLEEIKKEVGENVAKEEMVIANRLKRITSLLDMCHPSVKELYLQLEKKFSPKSCVSYLVDKKCNFCFVQVDSVLKAALEEGKSLETCPNCSRLLLPTL